MLTVLILEGSQRTFIKQTYLEDLLEKFPMICHLFVKTPDINFWNICCCFCCLNHHYALLHEKVQISSCLFLGHVTLLHIMSGLIITDCYSQNRCILTAKWNKSSLRKIILKKKILCQCSHIAKLWNLLINMPHICVLFLFDKISRCNYMPRKSWTGVGGWI